ncbi:tRNA-splicing endonuclease subunit Sen2-2-like isoform X1 [Salvia hispanica]|uniref:tRNA-splicing endonuclease subunit Sen2-2-like isoform X1 n=1 Tax=Salvia hispanica TaxID=49212 RepID=UPI0020093BFB|nr:tRNA-splicing endonuclease subunit Sen2-2-like isoform X1 [Salvia hispanica]XP_047947618.1 tRNA-splicing endonuclease subunit Sen2-2-like isoform X1 [Salvia hispanica]XP_047947619.1 tRNA-splicing endonuclease subunit Sen2-2-like isoform X1 [Salvia hispanica]XP_047947620.1 tRNA-splicing endonuclease subunit Sen2-2-like isoform X1 [Salvia hispanica]XP_047947621.1 tRNA-splicing endonuclease subunit Sen2-2-like isoform X1 [Salvia hispanica]
MAPRWKGKTGEAKEPMSVIVSKLQTSLIESNAQGLLSGCVVLLEALPEQTELLYRACIGRPLITAEKDKQWHQLSFEEALYLCSVLKCIKVAGENKSVKSDEELWHYMVAKRVSFPVMFKAYSHLRRKNWVVRAGSQYGVDYVAYRYHPAFVHSEYAVLALPDDDDGDGENSRLKVWSDFHCTLRLCGSVAKTMLVLHISRNGEDATVSLSGLEHYSVEERIVTRWNPEVSRDTN